MFLLKTIAMSINDPKGYLEKAAVLFFQDKWDEARYKCFFVLIKNYSYKHFSEVASVAFHDKYFSYFVSHFFFKFYIYLLLRLNQYFV